MIPCHNEAATVGQVVSDFRGALGGCHVYVYDNCSTDDTADRARAAGATVRHEQRPGKGYVVRRMLTDVDADIYVLVDGDSTYDASASPAMVELLITEQLDVVTGVRNPESSDLAYRRGHVAGNRAFTALHRALFGHGCTDVFSGYRVLSRRFAKSFPATATGFEIEAEMTAHALDIGVPMGEMVTRYVERPSGSTSKLRTYRDGVRILLKSLLYFKETRPFRFFAVLAAVLTLIAWIIGLPVLLTYIDTRQVPRLPSALLAASIQLTALLSLVCGIVLTSMSHMRREMKRLAYMSISSPPIAPETEGPAPVSRSTSRS